MCLAGFATYLIAKQSVTTTPSLTPRNDTPRPVPVLAVAEIISNEPPSMVAARGQAGVMKARKIFDARLKPDARLN
jgi:hypothetical protein